VASSVKAPRRFNPRIFLVVAQVNQTFVVLALRSTYVCYVLYFFNLWMPFFYVLVNFRLNFVNKANIMFHVIEQETQWFLFVADFDQ
jgi:hypothetical protein